MPCNMDGRFFVVHVRLGPWVYDFFKPFHANLSNFEWFEVIQVLYRINQSVKGLAGGWILSYSNNGITFFMLFMVRINFGLNFSYIRGIGIKHLSIFEGFLLIANWWLLLCNRIMNDANTEQSYEGFLWTLRYEFFSNWPVRYMVWLMWFDLSFH